MSYTLIEGPSPYDSIEVWRDFLRELEAYPKDDEGAQALVPYARQMIEAKEKAETEKVG